MENNPPKKTEHEDGSIGPIIGTLIIVILLLVTAVYIWGEHLNTAAMLAQQARQNSGTTTIITYSTSTEPAAIQNDLESSPTISGPGF